MNDKYGLAFNSDQIEDIIDALDYYAEDLNYRIGRGDFPEPEDIAYVQDKINRLLSLVEDMRA